MGGDMETQLSGTATLLITGFLALLFIAIGVVLIFLHRRNIKKAEESMSWKEATGTVNGSKVIQGNNVLMSNDDDGESTPVFYPEISYTYQVGGLEYTSKRLAFTGVKSHSKRENAEKAASLYPVGKQLSVYYDPKNPKEAVVDRTAKSSSMILVFGILFIIIGLATAVIGTLIIY
jgi:hypothetical protein